VPVVVDVEQAKRDPELVVLSAMAHGKEDVGAQIATAALEACRGLDAKRALFYLDLVGISLGDVARAAFKDLMISNYEFQTEFGKGSLGGEWRRMAFNSLLPLGVDFHDPCEDRGVSCRSGACPAASRLDGVRPTTTSYGIGGPEVLGGWQAAGAPAADRAPAVV